MNRKSVLGLIGLCVGLSLSGCQNDGSGWGSKHSRPDNGPPVARVRKEDRDKALADARKRGQTDRTVAAKNGKQTPTKNPYEFGDSYNVKDPNTEGTNEEAESYHKTTTRVTQPDTDPAGKAGDEYEEPSLPPTKKRSTRRDDPMPIPPPQPPPMEGRLPLMNQVAQPVQPKKPVTPELSKVVTEEDEQSVVEEPKMSSPVAPTPTPVKKTHASTKKHVPTTPPNPAAPVVEGPEFPTPPVVESKETRDTESTGPVVEDPASEPKRK